MTKRKQFCIICGCEETPAKELKDGFCPKCLAAEKEVKIHTIPTIRVCKVCGSLEERGKWVSPSSNRLEEDLLVVLKATPDRFIELDEDSILEVTIPRMPSSISSSSILVPIIVKSQTTNQERSRSFKELNTSVRLIPTICPNCSLVKRQYYEATLQIRAIDGKMLQNEKEILLNRINSLVDKIAGKHKQAFVSRFEDEPGGFDLYLGSSQLAHSIASRLRSKKGVLAKEAFKVGKLDKSTGKKKGKVTILIRLPKTVIEELPEKEL
nr:NMD3-related protein [Candidatus Njordarchaeota archaeon]